MGNYASEEWLGDWAKAHTMDPSEVPKAGMTEYNRVCKKLNNAEVTRALQPTRPTLSQFQEPQNPSTNAFRSDSEALLNVRSGRLTVFIYYENGRAGYKLVKKIS